MNSPSAYKAIERQERKLASLIQTKPLDLMLACNAEEVAWVSIAMNPRVAIRDRVAAQRQVMEIRRFMVEFLVPVKPKKAQPVRRPMVMDVMPV